MARAPHTLQRDDVLWSVWMVIRDVENVRCRFLPLDIYGLRAASLQRLLLLKLAKPVSLIQLYTINPASLFCCLEEPHFYVWPYQINTLNFQGGCWDVSIKEPSSPNPSFSVYLCIFSFLHSLHSPSLELCWMQQLDNTVFNNIYLSAWPNTSLFLIKTLFFLLIAEYHPDDK